MGSRWKSYTHSRVACLRQKDNLVICSFFRTHAVLKTPIIFWLCLFTDFGKSIYNYTQNINLPSTHCTIVYTRTWLRYVRVFAIANPFVVCRLSVCLSVYNVCAPYSGIEAFANTFFTAVYLGHPLTWNLFGDSPRETPSSGR